MPACKIPVPLVKLGPERPPVAVAGAGGLWAPPPVGEAVEGLPALIFPPVVPGGVGLAVVAGRPAGLPLLPDPLPPSIPTDGRTDNCPGLRNWFTALFLISLNLGISCGSRVVYLGSLLG